MANLSHWEKLCEGASEWNSWRDANPRIAPDLDGLDVSVGHRQFSQVHGGPINLCRTALRGANLAHATLTGADLDGAILAKADLSHARLENARFRGADLRDAVLDGADVLGARFDGARLEGARLHGARNLTQAQIDAAFGDATASLPGALVRPEHWIHPEPENPEISGPGVAVGEAARETSSGLYDLLGVPPVATLNEINEAYRVRAKRLHPDLNPNDQAAEEAFKDLAIGAKVLRDRRKREFYDRGDIDAHGRVTVYGETRRRRERLARDVALYFAVPFVAGLFVIAGLSWIGVFGPHDTRDASSIAEPRRDGAPPAAAALETGSTERRRGSAVVAREPPVESARPVQADAGEFANHGAKTEEARSAEAPFRVEGVRPAPPLEALSSLDLTPARVAIEAMEVAAREAPLSDSLPPPEAITVSKDDGAGGRRSARQARERILAPAEAPKSTRRRPSRLAARQAAEARRPSRSRGEESVMPFVPPPCKLTPACLRNEEMCGC